jgi:hypothetical protein
MHLHQNSEQLSPYPAQHTPTVRPLGHTAQSPPTPIVGAPGLPFLSPGKKAACQHGYTPITTRVASIWLEHKQDNVCIYRQQFFLSLSSDLPSQPPRPQPQSAASGNQSRLCALWQFHALAVAALATSQAAVHLCKRVLINVTSLESCALEQLLQYEQV